MEKQEDRKHEARRDLAQARTRFLLDEMEGTWDKWPASQRGRATKRARSLPVEVRTEGLPTAIAVLLADGRSETGALAKVLARWLLQGCPYRTLDRTQGTDARALLSVCVRSDRTRYQAAQGEALALLDQLKLLADALYSKDAEEVADD